MGGFSPSQIIIYRLDGGLNEGDIVFYREKGCISKTTYKGAKRIDKVRRAIHVLVRIS
jgi:hypothetical protein